MFFFVCFCCFLFLRSFLVFLIFVYIVLSTLGDGSVCTYFPTLLLPPPPISPSSPPPFLSVPSLVPPGCFRLERGTPSTLSSACLYLLFCWMNLGLRVFRSTTCYISVPTGAGIDESTILQLTRTYWLQRTDWVTGKHVGERFRQCWVKKGEEREEIEGRCPHSDPGGQQSGDGTVSETTER